MSTGLAPADRITPVFRDPAATGTYSEFDWELLVRQGRRSELLGALAARLAGGDMLGLAPERARRALDSARVLAEKHARDVRWEVRCILRALRPLGVPVVLLKGAGYLFAGSPNAVGRLFRDIDILVPRGALDDVERRLRDEGWSGSTPNPYDQRFYREWSHQIPPLRHFRRGVETDVHHTIVAPITPRAAPDPGALLAASRPVAGVDDLYTLSPVDMVLHCAVHLLHEGEFERALRDLVDIERMCAHYEGDLWPDLVERAVAFGCARPVYYALRYAVRVLGARVPAKSLTALRERADVSTARLSAMDRLFAAAVRPNHVTCDSAGAAVARNVLFVRGHMVRMPLSVLLPHLARKSYRRWAGDE